MEEKSKYEDLLEKQEISSLKDKIALPILLAVTILAAYLTFKPTADLAYIDSGYLENLKTCTPYTTSGKINHPANSSSTSTIKGYKDGKCILQTINVFIPNRILASNCALSDAQIEELYKAGGFKQKKIINKFKKEHACGTFKLKNQNWVQIK